MNLNNIIDKIVRELGLNNLLETVNEVSRAWVSEDGSRVLRVAEGLTHSDYSGLISGNERTTNLSEFENAVRVERAKKRQIGNGDDYNEERLSWMKDIMAEGWIRVGCFPVATSDTAYIEVNRITEIQLRTAQNFLKNHPEYRRSKVIIEQLQPRSAREARITKTWEDFIYINRVKPERSDL